MRNRYQERMVKKSCKTQDEWDDFCDHIYHERKDEESDETQREKTHLDKLEGKNNA